MPAIIKQRPLVPAVEVDRPSSTALVAAVLANVEECAGAFHSQLSDREFRELVRERGRSCDAALLELRRVALTRDSKRIPRAGWRLDRRRITGRIVSEPAISLRTATAETSRVRELEQEVVRLRRLLAEREPSA